MRLSLQLILLCGLASPATVPISPRSSGAVRDQVRVRETARVVQDTTSSGSTLRRVTLAGGIIGEKNPEVPRIGQVIVIDFSIDLDARDRASEAHRLRSGSRPGPQFMHQPDPPPLDDEGAFCAHLAPAGSEAARSRRHAGAVPVRDGDAYSGAVFVPVSGQYSFEQPGDGGGCRGRVTGSAKAAANP